MINHELPTLRGRDAAVREYARRFTRYGIATSLAFAVPLLVVYIGQGAVRGAVRAYEWMVDWLGDGGSITPELAIVALVFIVVAVAAAYFATSELMD